MIVAALQPGYLPWIGFFNLMKHSDLFIIEDNLQYTKQDWRNRNRIRTREGFTYLTVPVKKSPVYALINQIEIDNRQSWGERHWHLLKHNYSNAPYWRQYAPRLEEALQRPCSLLVDLDLFFIKFLASEFGIFTTTRLLSDLPVVFGPDKTRSLVELTRAVEADTFLEGARGQAFVDKKQFEAAGLEVRFQDYPVPPYRQQFTPFIPYLSALDLLLNEGPDGSAII